MRLNGNLIHEVENSAAPGGETMQHGPLNEASIPISCLIETLPCAVSVLDRDLCYLAVNARWENDNRVARADVLARPCATPPHGKIYNWTESSFCVHIEES